LDHTREEQCPYRLESVNERSIFSNEKETLATQHHDKHVLKEADLQLIKQINKSKFNMQFSINMFTHQQVSKRWESGFFLSIRLVFKG
jgi:hypothetical protein